MKYKSTRSSVTVNAMEALLHGLAMDGGLYVPETFPQEVLVHKEWQGLSYEEIATCVLSYFFSEIDKDTLGAMIHKAYGNGRFAAAEVVPFHSLDTDLTVAELFHGPTLAFKDLALSLFPHLLVAAKERTNEKKDILILTATSGDTGKAALEAFKDIEGISIIVFYPHDGVSPMQALQMQTQTGNNVHVLGLQGNFDEAQAFVKEVFTDSQVREKIAQRGYIFSSANSINIGRLLPQIVYYVWTYAQLIERGCITQGEAFNVVVPTGNFGNILAAYMAKRMGIPIHTLLCASNENHILTDFLQMGIYNEKRPFYKTTSPSMDIVRSSNLERFLYYVMGEDTTHMIRWQEQIQNNKQATVPTEILQQIQKEMLGGYASDEIILESIRHVYDRDGYLLDPHTAVGYAVYQKHKRNHLLPSRHTVLMATAHPYKFPLTVHQALGLANTTDPFTALLQLQDMTGIAIPRALHELSHKKRRFMSAVSSSQLESAVLEAADFMKKRSDMHE
ncbi:MULTISPECIES: threonine synthase [Megasphaera]|uniref:Threonine synthase n=1 Tax=Megasphaera hutchinsoni TaxID=1588748 RepID=A0A2J8BCK6_9FIRM|nr:MULTISPECIES: threonine synthase [Megasphaera]EGS33108.1 threonine synthase [Megasphaera sp. UPII 135-E]MUP48482.1 threonine synthase [Veillonellaceae bacterium M2-8]PNH22498.1 threonine synthase [Megasphaera genomosp. type_2]